MSSISHSYSRKRLHSPDFRDIVISDSEDEEAPPVKIKRKTAGASFFYYLLEIPVAFSARLKNLVLWISELPVKDFFNMAVKSGSTLPEETIVDDDDDDVVHIEEDDCEEQETTNPFLKRLENTRKNILLNSQHYKRDFDWNGTCSSRYHTRGSEVSVAYDSRFDCKKPMNGSSSGSWRPRHNGNGSHYLRSLKKDKLPTPISNPDTDVEILLDSPPIAPEPDDCEIISDLAPDIGPRIVTSQRPVRKANSVRNMSSQPGPSEMTAVTRSQSATPKSYTAHEVVRLQEKEQYQLLLEKYMNGNQYCNTVKKMKNEIAMQDDSDSQDFTGAHFTKEVLQQPVNTFLEKYCKPCQLVPHEKPKDEQNEVIEIIIDDDDEDDLEIVNVKLPKYKPNYHQKPDFFSADWINELKNTVNSQMEERLLIVHEQELMIEKYKKERLLERLNLGIQLPEPAEPELPALTTEMEEMVDKALHGDPTERICKTLSGEYISRKDMETLDGLCWLNDLVITSYFELIQERSKQEGYPSVHAYNTFFYSRYKAIGYSGVRRWTRKIDIFSYDLNFIPLHLGVHWCLGVIDHRSKKVCYYDSMGNGEDQCVNLLHEYLCMEFKDKKGAYLDPSTYTKEVMKDIPQQMNGSDCGMFTLKYAEYLSRNVEITFSQKDMQYFRRRMVYELITLQLL